ncbi:MAG: patatin-like phospholipase family protein, partial [Gemmatimonadota bacterium]
MTGQTQQTPPASANLTGQQGTASDQPQAPPCEGRIGREDERVRALAFAGGGFDAAMQLGVAHALLVGDCQAPDIVVGISAGAVNAAALAEILQAGRENDPEKKRSAQTARFREFLEALQSSPGELAVAALPDPIQVETERPLQSLDAPTRSASEHKHRQRAIKARSGLIDIYNRVLRMRVSVGLLARSVRIALGIRAAGAIWTGLGKAIALMLEVADGWILLWRNLPRLAPPGLAMVLPGRFMRPATAGELISRSVVLSMLGRVLLAVLGTMLALMLWIPVAALLVAALV